MMGFQFAAGRRQAAFNNFLMEAWRPSSAPAANVETLILTGVVPKNKLLRFTFVNGENAFFPSPCAVERNTRGHCRIKIASENFHRCVDRSM